MGEARAVPRLTIEDWSLLQMRLRWGYEGEVRHDYRRMRSQNGLLIAWCILAGSVKVKCRGRVWRAEAGHWLMLGPEPFDQAFSDDARILSVSFTLRWPSGEALVRGPLRLDAAEHPELLKAGRRLVRFIEKAFPGARTDLWRTEADLDVFLGQQQRFSAWVHAYVTAVANRGVVPVRIRGDDPRVREVLRSLDRHCWAEPFSEERLAGELGMSTGHLERIFRRDMGMTPKAYLRKRRLETALAALADRSIPIKQVAGDLGFGSVSHFSHWIRKTNGRSPRAYRLAETRRAGTPGGGGAE